MSDGLAASTHEMGPTGFRPGGVEMADPTSLSQAARTAGTETHTMTVTTNIHSTTCTGTHNWAGDCVTRVDTAGGRIDVIAIPCDNAYLQIVDGLTAHTVNDLDDLIAQLQQLRPTLAAANAEADCAGCTDCKG